MSYSFTFEVPTKAEARTRAEAEFDRVVAQQPVHMQDKAAALAALDAYLALLEDDANQDIHVTLHGSLGYYWRPEHDAANAAITSAALGVSVYPVVKGQPR
jgi:hypothetical protein